MVEKFFISPWRKGKAWGSGAGSDLASPGSELNKLRQASGTTTAHPGLLQLSTHHSGSPKLDTHKMQINLEEAKWSAKNWSNFPSKVHSHCLMSGELSAAKPDRGQVPPPCRAPGTPGRVTAPWGHLAPHREQPQELWVPF